MKVVYPIVYMIPGDDHGSYENFHESVAGLFNNPNLLAMSMVGVPTCHLREGVRWNVLLVACTHQHFSPCQWY